MSKKQEDEVYKKTKIIEKFRVKMTNSRFCIALCGCTETHFVL